MTISSFTGEYDFLSNFYPVNITLRRGKDDTFLFASVEHAYQACKTLITKEIKLFEDPSLSAGQAKRLGRKITLRDDWDCIKIQVMWRLLNLKFSEDNPILVEKLLATGDEDLIEGNWWGDVFWGVCNEVGQNHLGKLLMNKRSQLQFERKFLNV